MSEQIKRYQISHLIKKDIETFMQNLDSNKPHGDDMIGNDKTSIDNMGYSYAEVTLQKCSSYSCKIF